MPHLRLQQRLVLVLRIVHRRKRMTHRIMRPLRQPRSRAQTAPPTLEIQRRKPSRKRHTRQPRPSIRRQVHHSPLPSLRRPPQHNHMPILQIDLRPRQSPDFRRPNPTKTPQHHIPKKLPEILPPRPIRPRPRSSHNQQPPYLPHRQQLNLPIHSRQNLKPILPRSRCRIRRHKPRRQPPRKQRAQIRQIPLLRLRSKTVPANPVLDFHPSHRVTQLRFPPPNKRQTSRLQIRQIIHRLPRRLLRRQTPPQKLPQRHLLPHRPSPRNPQLHRLLNRPPRRLKPRRRRRKPHPQIIRQTHPRIPMPAPPRLLLGKHPHRLIPRRKINLLPPPPVPEIHKPIIHLPSHAPRFINNLPNLHPQPLPPTHAARTRKMARVGKTRHEPALKNNPHPVKGGARCRV